MRVNVLVVGSSQPWMLVEDVPTGEEGIEGYLELGEQRSDAEVQRKAEAELAKFRDGQTQITCGVDPTGVGDVPFVDYTIGDTVTVDGASRRVVGLTFSRDSERPGRLVYVPQVGDIIPSPQARSAWVNKKMANGTLGGSARSAAPAPQPDPPAPDPTVTIKTVQVTQAEYDALDPGPLDGVLYAITG